MELKLKEGVNLKNLTTQHEIIMASIGLIEDNIIHPKSEIKLELMIACTNIMTDGMVFKLIKDKEGLELFNFIQSVIEPFYYKEIYSKYQIEIQELEKILLDYYKDYNLYSNSFGSILNNLLNYFIGLSDNDKALLTEFVNNIDVSKKDKDAKNKVIANKKIEDLINKYTNKNN